MATVGGNLLQRTRCLYFQDVDQAVQQAASPGSGCPARSGLAPRPRRSSAPVDACIATHPSDMAVALAALDAVVHVAGPGRPAELAARRVATGCPATTRSATPRWRTAT